MNDSIKEGLEGLSKMDGVSNFLYALMYWVGFCPFRASCCHYLDL